MENHYERTEPDYYTEIYEYYIETDKGQAVINNIDKYLEQGGSRNIGLTFKALIRPAPSEESFSITVPREKNGRLVDRVEIYSERHFDPSAETKDLPTLKYLYIPSGVSSISIETQALRLPKERINLINFCKVEISPDNPYFCVCENGIYSKDMTVLHYIFSPEEHFEVPPQVKRIRLGAGRALKGLRRLTVHEGVTEIERAAFAFCPDLEHADVGAECIGVMAFEKCPSLTSVRLNSKILCSSAFYNCGSLNSAELLNTEIIENNVFEGCSSLKKIKLPDTLHSIGSRAFRSTGIARLTIPYSVKALGGNICGINTMPEIISKNGTVSIEELNGRFARTGTTVSVRSYETDEIMFKFVMLESGSSVFTKNGIDFTYYDRLFIFDIKIYVLETMLLAAWTRFQYPYGADARTREIFRKYVINKGSYYLSKLINDETSPSVIADYSFVELFDDDVLLSLIDYSANKRKPEITALLMQAMNERRNKQ